METKKIEAETAKKMSENELSQQEVAIYPLVRQAIEHMREVA